MTAGDQLCDDMARSLAHAVRDAGGPLAFDKRQTLTIEAAAAGGCEQVAAPWAADLVEQARPSLAVKIGASELHIYEVPPAGFEPAAFCSGGRRSIP
jgi:hypothetical protein